MSATCWTPRPLTSLRTRWVLLVCAFICCSPWPAARANSRDRMPLQCCQLLGVTMSCMRDTGASQHSRQHRSSFPPQGDKERQMTR